MEHPATLRVSVASPCKASWQEMKGDDRVRFCGACNKNVFNLSAMTRAEADALLAREGKPPCVTFFQRADGTVMTQDCPVGRMAKVRRRVSAAAVAAASLVLSACREGVTAAHAAPSGTPPAHDACATPLDGGACAPEAEGLVRTTGEPMPPRAQPSLPPPPPPKTRRGK